MNDQSSTARRYHWLSEHVTSFVDEPHEAVCCDVQGATLNLVASESGAVRQASAELASQSPEATLKVIEKIPDLRLPSRHALFPEMDVDTRYLSKILLKTYERAPENFETLLGIEGVGPKTLRALALASELIYGAQASTRDPARFAFAHGGKDGIPYPVDKITYDRTIEVLEKAINRSAIDRSEKVKAFRRLAEFGTTDTAAPLRD